MSLKYNGKGENIINVPAHDLSDTDIERLAFQANKTPDEYIAMLTSRGLYSVVKPARKKQVTRDDNIEISEGDE